MDEKQIRKSLISQVLPNPTRERARFNMTLGSFIKALKRERKGLDVFVNGTGWSPSRIYSYPKFQGDIAFSLVTPPVTVIELIERCDELMGRTIQGPDGPMDISSNCPIWMYIPSKINEPILDVIADDGVIKIITIPRK